MPHRYLEAENIKQVRLPDTEEFIFKACISHVLNKSLPQSGPCLLLKKGGGSSLGGYRIRYIKFSQLSGGDAHVLNNMRILWCWTVSIELKYLVNSWILSDNGDLLEVLMLVIGILHGVSECLGRSTWCPGCKAIAVMGADCKEHICDIVYKGRNCKIHILYSVMLGTHNDNEKGEKSNVNCPTLCKITCIL